MPSQILLFSDLHIFNHKSSLQRLQDCLDVLRWAFQSARERNVKDVLFLGDLFHDRQKIQVLAYHNTFEIFKEYQDLNITLLLGNHDLWFYDKWDVSSVMPLSAMSNVEVIAKPCTLEIAGLSIDCMPFTHDPITLIKESFQQKSPVLCAHIAVDDAVLNKLYNTKAEVSIESEKDVVKVNKDVFNGWQKVFLGHYHCEQRLDERVEYIGSPLELSFNEAFQQKHIILLNTADLSCEYIVNEFSPKHLIIKHDQMVGYDLNNNFVQIQVEDIESSDIIDIKKSIIDSNHVQSLEFKELKTKDIKEEHSELQTKFDIAHGDVLERYVEVTNTELDKIELLNIGRSLVESMS